MVKILPQITEGCPPSKETELPALPQAGKQFQIGEPYSLPYYICCVSIVDKSPPPPKLRGWMTIFCKNLCSGQIIREAQKYSPITEQGVPVIWEVCGWTS